MEKSALLMIISLFLLQDFLSFLPRLFDMFEPDKNDQHCKKNEEEERIERFQLPCDCHFLEIEEKEFKV